MKAKELEKLDKINEEKKLSQEVKNKIAQKALNNFLIALDILLFFIILIVASRNLSKGITEVIYKISSFIFLIFTIVLFEIAYKKDDGNICIHSIEMLILSITTLLTPYIFINRPSTFTLIVGAYFTAYYILKNLVIYKKAKNNYLRNTSDISQIVKKESQDDFAIKQKEKMQENIKEKKKPSRPKKDKPEEIVKAPKKVGRPKKEITEEKVKEEKRKPGRPKKDKAEEIVKAPKKVGRPKKNITEEKVENEKRKPGRPKKVTTKNE